MQQGDKKILAYRSKFISRNFEFISRKLLCERKEQYEYYDRQKTAGYQNKSKSTEKFINLRFTLFKS